MFGRSTSLLEIIINAYFASMSTAHWCSCRMLSFAREMQVTNPTYKQGIFGPNTATTGLRRHLADRHMEAWLKGCDQLRISIKSQGVQDAINQYRGQAPESQFQERKPFSNKAFVDAIVKFIVANDQVC